MPLLLIPLDRALPAVQAFLGSRTDEQLTAAETRIAAELLDGCVRTGETLVAFALGVAGRPSPQ